VAPLGHPLTSGLPVDSGEPTGTRSYQLSNNLSCAVLSICSCYICQTDSHSSTRGDDSLDLHRKAQMYVYTVVGMTANKWHIESLACAVHLRFIHSTYRAQRFLPLKRNPPPFPVEVSLHCTRSWLRQISHPTPWNEVPASTVSCPYSRICSRTEVGLLVPLHLANADP
jgi:hypothetical protein